MIQDTKAFNTASFRRISAFIGPAFLLILFAGLARWSWRKWADIFVDFGRELYIPWQISTGKILYKELAHLFGPLSCHVNASLFYLFGDSYTVLIWANMALLAVFLGFLYNMIEKTCSRLPAVLCCGVVLSIFSFSQYMPFGNYNFISPYSHEATHGIILSLIMIHQLWRFSVTGHGGHLFAAGLLFGLVYLTKADILLASALVMVSFLMLYGFRHRNIKKTVLAAVVLIVGGCIPPGGFLIYFLSVMDAGQAVKAVNGSWSALVGTGIEKNAFYVGWMGFNDIGGNTLRLAMHGLLVSAALGLLLFLSHYVMANRQKRRQTVFCGILAFILFALIFYYVTPYNSGFSLPLTTAAASIFLLWSYLKCSAEYRKEADRIFPILLWAVFALGLLLKMGLMSRLYHYGFYLALPAVTVLICVAIHHLPRWTSARLKGAPLFKSVIVIILIIIAGRFIITADSYYQARTYALGAGGDTILTFAPRIDPRGIAIAHVVASIKHNLKPGETLAVLPEGVMINYLTRRTNPTPYTNFMMPEMLAYGEGAILKAFIAAPPDYIVLIHKNTKEYGVGFFGQDAAYGKCIMDWINQQYRPCYLIDHEPLRDGRFGIKILRKMTKS